jgi:FkbM family methyltransferase
LADALVTDTFNFKYGNLDLISPDIYYPHLKEIFIFDIYRINLLRQNDIVLDLGASTGEFSILASKKVGKKGKVIAIEPNIQDHKMLEENIRRNNCQNIIPINFGVGNEPKESEITYYGRTFRFKVDTLEHILSQLKLAQDINFIKMDIEGFEREVISNSIEIIKKARVISIEIHGKDTKIEIDKLLGPNGFVFKPITMRHIYQNAVKNLLMHPHVSSKMYLQTITNNPNVLRKAITGLDITKDFLINGSYVRI